MEFLNTAKEFDQSQDLGDFLEFLQLVSGNSNEDKSVNLMTAHASKGLEFPVVFIIGVGEGLFPLKCRSIEELEEERRLFYVALTRAEDVAYVSYPKNRNVYGEYRQYKASHFIKTIPTELIKEI